MESLDNFVDEMINTAVKKLRDEPAPPSPNEPGQTSEEPKQNLTPETISGLIPQGADLEGLINNFMEKYAAAKTGPCLSVEGQKAIFSQRPTVKTNTMGQQKNLIRTRPAFDFTQRRPIYNLPKGGSRRKNKKSKRTRRKQRGGEIFLAIGIALAVGLIFLMVMAIAQKAKEINA